MRARRPVGDLYLNRSRPPAQRVRSSVNATKPQRERLTLIRIFEELRGLGYDGSYSSVWRHAQSWEADRGSAAAEAYIPLSFAPGEAYQFDWSHEIVLLDGVTVTVKVAHMRLCHSRMFFVRAYPRETQEMVFDAHDRAFSFFRGACTRGIYDNMKTAVDAIFIGRDRRYNRRFLQMCGHYLVEPEACTPAAGWEKGQVENQVGLVRERFFTPRLRFKTLEDLNGWLADKCVTYARIKGRTLRLGRTAAFVWLLGPINTLLPLGTMCANGPKSCVWVLLATLRDTAMADEREFRIRPGRIRSTRAQQARPFIAQTLAAAKKAGGGISRLGLVTAGNRSRFGQGQRASIQANRLITSRSRGAVVKARVVRHCVRATPLARHLSYLRREGVTRDGEKARLFGPQTRDADGAAFSTRAEDDRHHFRFIVSPDDALDMMDLKSFTRDLVRQMEKDLVTRLDWIAADHWNTEHPHVHLIVRGVRDDGQDLVISRDYITEGMRDRARDLITQELGLRADLDIRRTLERQIAAERWTQLDRQLVRDARRTGVIDLAPCAHMQPDEYDTLKLGRLRKLEAFGLADQVAPGQWVIDDKAETTLRELGERGDIIKRLHHALTERGIERCSASYVLAAESLDTPIIGRLADRGLDDALSGTAYAVVDGIDGRIHHIKLGDLEAAGDSPPGSIVELRKFDDARGQRRVALAVRSDLGVDEQVTALGATWLDRQNTAREPVSLSDGGFGATVREAMSARCEHLVEQGLAERQGKRIVFIGNLIDTLRRRELAMLGEKLAAETGLPFSHAASGDFAAGIYRRRITLASGRFAMLDDGLGFQLVPWTPPLERQLGRHVCGVVRDDGSVNWSFARKRGLGL